MTIAAYIRVSSVSQNLASQKEALSNWLVSHGHDLDQVQWFKDTDSGKNMKRKGFKALEKAIFDGSVHTVVVYKLDRLARSMRNGINVISEWCEQEIRVVSITEQLDLSGTIGKIVAGVLFGIGQIEREYTLERQAIGISAARAKGIYTGRTAGTTKRNPARARQLKAQGLKHSEIAAALGVSLRTVANYLKIGKSGRNRL